MPRGKAKARDGIYTRKDRPGFWASWMDASGKRRQRKLAAHTLQQARMLLAAEKARVEKTLTLGYAPPSVESLEAVSKRFLKHQKVRLTPAAYLREDGILEAHIRPFFGDKTNLADIRRSDVQKYITHRSGNVSPASVTKELNVLKHLMALSVEWELIPTNQAHGVKPPRVPAGRVRYLQPTELRTVLEACSEWLRPIAALAAATGMRRGEILGLRWMDVDFGGGRIMLPQTKNGEGRIVYLNALAKDALEAVPRNKAKNMDCIFTGESVTPENVSLAFLRACRAVNIPDFRFHDLRHTAASWMRMKGADIHTVALILGHKDLRMARYQHLSPAFLSDAVKLLDGAYAEPPKDVESAKGGESSCSIVTVALPAENSLEQWSGLKCFITIGVPDGIRTRVTAVKGRCPRPLDDGDAERSPRKLPGDSAMPA
jgi:integrase